MSWESCLGYDLIGLCTTNMVSNLEFGLLFYILLIGVENVTADFICFLDKGP